MVKRKSRVLFNDYRYFFDTMCTRFIYGVPRTTTTATLGRRDFGIKKQNASCLGAQEREYGNRSRRVERNLHGPIVL